MDQLNIKELRNVKNVTVYKIIGGEYDTLASYNAGCQPSHDATDWSAIYTQFQRDHVLGTLPYHWERSTHATLIAITFTSVDIVVIIGSLMHDSRISGEEKATAIKQRLQIQGEEPLMETLGKRRMVALIPETEDEWELVVPHQLLDNLEYSERIVARFQRHAAMPITSGWQREGSKVWEPWREEVDAFVESIPDLDMDWTP